MPSHSAAGETLRDHGNLNPKDQDRQMDLKERRAAIYRRLSESALSIQAVSRASSVRYHRLVRPTALSLGECILVESALDKMARQGQGSDDPLTRANIVKALSNEAAFAGIVPVDAAERIIAARREDLSRIGVTPDELDGIIDLEFSDQSRRSAAIEQFREAHPSECVSNRHRAARAGHGGSGALYRAVMSERQKTADTTSLVGRRVAATEQRQKVLARQPGSRLHSIKRNF